MLLFHNAKGLILGKAIIAGITSIRNVLTSVVITKSIINIVTKGEPIVELIKVMGCYILFVICSLLASTLFEHYYAPQANEKLSNKLYQLLHRKLTEIDLSRYDDPEFYNEYILVMNHLKTRVRAFMSNIERFVIYITNLTLITSVFATIDLGLFLITIVSTASTLLLNAPIAKALHQKLVSTESIRRKKAYLVNTFFNHKFAKEIQTSKIGDLLLTKYIENHNDLHDAMAAKSKKIAILNFFQVYLSGYFTVSFVMVVYLGYQALVTHRIDVGGFVAAFNGINILLGSIYFILGNFIRQLKEDSLWIDSLKQVIDEQPKIISGSLQIASIQAISFQNVSFTYPGNTEATLRNIYLDISQNEKIAIVGFNGAGKTTLIKLLMRLYDVTEGSIRVNGVDIREYSLEQYREKFGSIFQDYQIYTCPIANNISMDNQYDRNLVETALKGAGYIQHNNSTQFSINTEIQREYCENGEFLSGGQYQKIATARALYSKKAEIIVMDEPSSALDPIAESNFYNSICDSINGKILILISHRLSTTKYVDRIVVLESGRIVEVGSHDELLSRGGVYAEMWNCQANKYTQANIDGE